MGTKQDISQFDLAIMNTIGEMTKKQLAKRVPAIPEFDYRRITFCLIEDRIQMYKEAEIKFKQEDILVQFGITKKAYYAWYEKYHSYYKQCKKFPQ
ncbi:MAG: hypothetical protein IJ718_03115 [Paludibacteraceae bacterium]|nr:hypothetical protein [Paludibacteraceae bacterium]